MKIFDPKRHLPLGWDWESTKVCLLWGHLFSAFPLFGFLFRYFEARERLYVYHIQPDDGTAVLVLDPNRTIAPFFELLWGLPLLGLWIFLVVMPLLVWLYYDRHTQGAMSVYSMRRLPDRWEYHRRCWAQPLLSAAAECLLFAALTGLCWLLWFFATPAACRP